MMVRFDVGQHAPTISTSRVFSIVELESLRSKAEPFTRTTFTTGRLVMPRDVQYSFTSPPVRTPVTGSIVPVRPPPTEITPTTTGVVGTDGNPYIVRISAHVNLLEVERASTSGQIE
jgi:hypothetical protein